MCVCVCVCVVKIFFLFICAFFSKMEKRRVGGIRKVYFTIRMLFLVIFVIDHFHTSLLHVSFTTLGVLVGISAMHVRYGTLPICLYKYGT